MKYVVSWQSRPNVTEEVQARSLEVFRKWSPAEGTTYLQFLGRIDGPGGFAVVETDDPALLAGITAIFSAFFDMNVYPVWISRRRHASAVRQSSSANRCDQQLILAQAFVRLGGRALQTAVLCRPSVDVGTPWACKASATSRLTRWSE